MSDNLAPLDLRSDAARTIIQLTNSQFTVWHDILKSRSEGDLPAGSHVDFWFILSSLAMLGDSFQANKQDAYRSIPSLQEETVRKYVSIAGKLGFVETVKSIGMIYLRLTRSGREAVAIALAHWWRDFSTAAPAIQAYLEARPFD